MSTSIRKKIDNEVESSLSKLVKDNKKHKYGSSNLIGPFLFEVGLDFLNEIEIKRNLNKCGWVKKLSHYRDRQRILLVFM